MPYLGKTTKFLSPEEQALQYEKLAEKKGIKIPEKKKPKTSMLNRIFDVIRTSEYAAGGLLAGKGIQKGIKEKISPSQALGISTKETPLLSPRGVAGLAADILLDFTTYLTFGAGGAVKIAAKTGQKVALSKVGEKILFKTVKDFGEEAGRKKMAELLVQKGGEKYLAKTGLKFAGAEIVPRKVFTKTGQITEKIIEKTPIAGKAYTATKEVLKGAFKPFAKQKEIPLGEKYVSGFLKLVKGIRAESFQSSQEMGKMAKETQRIVGKNGSATILDLVETGKKFIDTKKGLKVFEKNLAPQLETVQKGLSKKIAGINISKAKTVDEIADIVKKSLPKDKAIIEAVDNWKITSKMVSEENIVNTVLDYVSKGRKEMAKVEKEKGLLKSELDNYARHLLTPKGREFVKGGGVISSELTKPLRTKLGAAKERKFVRIVSELGEDITWKKDKIILGKYNKTKIIDRMESVAERKIKIMQELQKKLASRELTGELKKYKDYIKFLKKHISKDPVVKQIAKGVEEFSQKEFDETIQSITKLELEKLNPLIGELEMAVRTSQGKEFLKGGIETAKRIPKERKIIDIEKKILEVQKELVDNIRKYNFFDFVDKEGKFYKAVKGAEEYKGFGQLTIKEINDKMREKVGGDLFEPNIFKAFAYRKAESIKAVRTDDFLNWVGKEFGEDAPKIQDGIKYIESSAKQLKGKYIPEPIAKHIDETMKFMTNDEATNSFLKFYDKLLNTWKGSVTGYFPAFHTRNALGGSFNNWLAGVKIEDYAKARGVLSGKKGVLKTKIGDISYDQIRKEIKEMGVTGQPGYLDVVKTVDDFLSTSITGKIKSLPRGAMEIVENNLRVPLYINRRLKGEGAEEALGQVLKYHFDYMPEGLTFFERNIMRRLIPFYRWTRGNIPLQVESLITQPGKYASMAKTIDKMSEDVKNEELALLPDYMKEGLPIKVPDSIAKLLGGKIRAGNVNYIYGLGIPAEDINKIWRGDLRRTIESIMSEGSPLIKFPIESVTGRNLFFGSQIEDFDKAPTFLEKAPEPLKEWLGFEKITYKDKNGKEQVKFSAEPRKLHFLQSVFARGWVTADKMTNDDYTSALKVSYALLNLKVRSVDLEYQEYLLHKKTLEGVEKELERKGVLKRFEKYYVPKK